MSEKDPDIAFDFGANWIEFASKSLETSDVDRARQDFKKLVRHGGVSKGSFLDIGFGQGLSILVAAEMGLCATGIDVNNKNCTAFVEVRKKFFPKLDTSINLFIGSILNDEVTEMLQLEEPNGFDIVHAWGVLHHTGQLDRALEKTVKLVSPTGCLILAIYTRHWSSPLWRVIKKSYCRVPAWGQRLFEGLFWPIVGIRVILSKELRTGVGHRGMHFMSDLRDWLGGYPYEYMSVSEISDWAALHNLNVVFTRNAAGWTGCNEYVFKRKRET